MKLSTMDEVSEKRRAEKVEWFRVIRDQDLGHLKELLSEGFCPDTLDEDSWSALHTASWNGFEEVVCILIASDCDLNIVGRDGSTPLMLASQQGHLAIVKKLLEFGCDVQKTAVLGECCDVTALHLAAQYGHRDIVVSLIRAGAMVGAAMSIQGITGITSLHLAVQTGHLEVIEMLLASGVDVNISTHSASESIT